MIFFLAGDLMPALWAQDYKDFLILEYPPKFNSQTVNQSQRIVNSQIPLKAFTPCL